MKYVATLTSRVAYLVEQNALAPMHWVPVKHDGNHVQAALVNQCLACFSLMTYTNINSAMTSHNLRTNYPRPSPPQPRF